MNNALITDEHRIVLLATGRESLQNPNFDPAPVVKLFTPDASATWLLTEIDPDDHDHALAERIIAWPAARAPSAPCLSGLEQIRHAVGECRLDLAHRLGDGFIAGEDRHRHAGTRSDRS